MESKKNLMTINDKHVYQGETSLMIGMEAHPFKPSPQEQRQVLGQPGPHSKFFGLQNEIFFCFFKIPKLEQIEINKQIHRLECGRTVREGNK